MQLREVVDTVTADEPPLSRSVDDIVAAGRRAQRRRRAGFASAGAAGLVAIAVIGVAVTVDPQRQASVVDGAAPASVVEVPQFNFTFEGYDAGKLHVQDPVTVSTAYQMASIYADGRFTNDEPIGPDDPLPELPDARLNAYLTVYQAGAFDPAGVAGGKELTAHGHKAVQAAIPGEPGGKTFAWEYADDAWAVVTSVSNDPAEPSFAELAELVPGLKTTAERPATLPFTVGYVPDGFAPLQVGSHASPGLGGINVARDGTYGGVDFVSKQPAASGLTAPYEAGLDGPIPDSFGITVLPSGNASVQPQAGRTECFWESVCYVSSSDGKVLIEVSGHRNAARNGGAPTGADLPVAELTRIADSVELADLGDDSSWVPVADALPL